MIRRASRFFMAVLAGYLASIASVQACTICLGPKVEGLLLPTDDSLELAIKTREAVLNGKLGEDPQETPLVGIMRWIVRKGTFTVPETIHIVAVDSGEKCGLRWSETGPVIFSDVAGPADKTLVTTRRTLHAIATGKITLDEAISIQVARLSKTTTVATSQEIP